MLDLPLLQAGINDKDLAIMLKLIFLGKYKKFTDRDCKNWCGQLELQCAHLGMQV